MKCKGSDFSHHKVTRNPDSYKIIFLVCPKRSSSSPWQSQWKYDGRIVKYNLTPNNHSVKIESSLNGKCGNINIQDI